jgi:hypothetical protein
MKITAMQHSGKQLGTDSDVAFANSAPQDTQKTLDIAVPTTSAKGSYKLIVYNPSTVTALTVKIFSEELALKGATRYTYEKSLTVPAVTTTSGTSVNTSSFVIEDILATTGVRLIISNNTVLGASDGFTATFRLRELF